jgi:excisionase family DNA binding protein
MHMTLTELAATQLPPTITIDQAAELVGISRGAAYRAVHTGEIPSLRIGRRLVVPSAKLLDMLGLHVTETDTEPTINDRDDAPTSRPDDPSSITYSHSHPMSFYR